MSETYAVYTTRTVDKALEKIPEQDRGRIESVIYDLGDDPRPPQSIGLQGSTTGGARRVRQGDYRVIYEVDDEAREVTVTKVAHRKDVYRP